MGGKDELRIWPPHCIVDEVRQGIVAPIMDSLTAWVEVSCKGFKVVPNGQNPHTEHYGGLEAVVLIEDDPNTGLNTDLLSYIAEHDSILLLARPYRIALRQLLGKLLSMVRGGAGRIAVLLDGTSPVGGFENKAKDFLREMEDAGVKFSMVSQVFK